VIVIWRFTGARRLSAEAEERAQKLVAISFFLLAPYIAVEAVRALVNADHASTSYLGIGLSVGSIVTMMLPESATRARPDGPTTSVDPSLQVPHS